MHISHELQEQIRKVIQGLGYEFWGMETGQEGRRAVLRIYIDSPKGILHQDCQLVSRQLDAFLEVELTNAVSFFLEISSPGADRRLFTIEQCQRYIGQCISLKLLSPVQEKKRYAGILLRTTEENIELHIDGMGTVSIPFSTVYKAHLVADFSKPKALQ